ncbi:MAG TPA: ABC transporter ATP-binding protein [Peptococcaceae bacterium]|nr:MAG: Phosphate ABC transporter, ATP-binding protein [Clostridia bacterium 41_269]HBT20572.1 ABC transporter ATP-binding protein [Peptococcaceae bacterium]
MFVLKNVRYKNILYIDHLVIPKGRITCITGESGSGKTTLLKLLNNLISSDSGEIFYMGKNMREIDPVQLRREVVLLPQTPVIFPGTIKDNLLIGRRFSERPPVGDDELSVLLEKTRLSKDLASSAAELSGGEKQRLALCRVLLMEPDALLLDEPTSALDNDTADLVMGLVANYARDKRKTIVMVTHSKELARIYGEKLVTINGGRIVHVEEVAE